MGKKHTESIEFKFRDGTTEITETVIADKIKVKVTFPLSPSSLTDTIRKVKNITKVGYIDTGIDTDAWVYVKKNPDGNITIYE